MTSLADYAAAHRIAYDELASVIAGLDDDQLATQSLCPDWDVRACAAHAIGIDKALTGWMPDTENLFDFAIAARFMEEAVSMSPDKFASAITAIADARVADLESLDPSVVDEPSMTPVGPQAYGNFLQIRVFDLWVHNRDIAIPLGVELPDGGPTAEQALNEVHRSMGYIAGKKIGLEDGMSMTVEVTGGAPRTMHVAGRRACWPGRFTRRSDVHPYRRHGDVCDAGVRPSRPTHESTAAGSPGQAIPNGARRRPATSASRCKAQPASAIPA